VPAAGDSALFVPVDPRTLDALLAELGPHTASDVIDALARLGALPQGRRNPDDRIFTFYHEPDPPPDAAAAVYARVLALA
jgi:hypothetical protein